MLWFATCCLQNTNKTGCVRANKRSFLRKKKLLADTKSRNF